MLLFSTFASSMCNQNNTLSAFLLLDYTECEWEGCGHFTHRSPTKRAALGHCARVQSAQVMALMLPGAGAALDKEQAQLDNVVVAHGFRPPLPPAPPSFVPMVTPPAPIGYVEGHRPLFLLDTSSKTMARKGRMQLMRDVLTALVQPCGEVRDFVPRLSLSLFQVKHGTLACE
jgi:hypothetical protein